jgi:Ca2+-dependent lipid-binding protein
MRDQKMKMKPKRTLMKIPNNSVPKNLISERPFLSLKVRILSKFKHFIERRRRKERKQKEKEQKKAKALNGEDSASEMTKGPEIGTTKGASDDDEEPESSESSSSSEETKDETAKRTQAPTPGKKQTRSNNDEGEISSVTTRQNKTERNHYVLRMAIDEKYIPSSIKNLRFAANIIFMILLLLASKLRFFVITLIF